MPSKNLGRVSIVPKGTWNINTVYNRLDAVVYDGSSWLAKKKNIGQQPMEASDAWQLLAAKGEEGKKGNPGPKGDAFTYEDFTPEQLAALKGEKGDKGDKGDTGDTGDVGPAGKDGKDGAAGEDGKTAYQYAVDGGYTGTEQEFAAKMAYDSEAVDNQLRKDIENLTNVHHYGARWNKAISKMERTGDAAGITTNLTNFAHRGSVNANYDNPFDKIYPWSGCKLCNIDLDTYRTLKSGSNLTDCVVAWEGDPDFSYKHENGVWKYRPEFWGTSYDGVDGYHYFDITDKPIGGYVHYRAEIIGRWRGVQETREIDGASKSILLPKPGMPCKRAALSTIHSYAKNAGMTLDSIFSLDGSILMCIIEAADFNAQNAWGNGVSSLYRENAADTIVEEATESVTVTISNANASNVIPGAIFDIGTSIGGNQVGSFTVQSVEVSGSNKIVTIDRAVTVTTANTWSVHGRANIADEEIGSKSGYIGTNGQCDCYYRGEVFWGNIWLYILGTYHQANTNHVFLAKSDAESDNYDAINTENHLDTGVVLSSSGGYIKTIGFLTRSGVLSVPIFCTEVGGSSDNPVGDYYYVSVGSNTILVFGGYAGNGANGGLCAHWSHTASRSLWSCGGRPRLKSP